MKLTDVLTLTILGVQALIFFAQAVLARWQGQLTKKQLEVSAAAARAAETAASAALASLNRPWLFIEKVVWNNLEWLESNANLTADFHLANYGNAPADVKSLKIALFLGPHHHHGIPQEMRAALVTDFPKPDEIEYFLSKHGRPATTGGDARLQYSQSVIMPGDSLHLTMFVQTKLEANLQPGLRLEGLAEGYMIGRIYYALPSQLLEVVTFCLKSENGDKLIIFNDFPPYNERRSAPRGSMLEKISS